MAGDPDNLVIGIQEAPEIFVDGFRGVMTNGQTVKINFFQNRFDAGTEETLKIAAFTMVMAVSDFIAIAQALPKLLEEFQEKGALTVVTSEGSANT